MLRTLPHQLPWPPTSPIPHAPTDEGVVLLSKTWKFTCLSPSCSYTSFEFHAVTVTDPAKMYFLVVYRPPGQLGKFIDEFDTLLSTIPDDGTPLLVLGDFNIHLDKAHSADFLALLSTFDLKQFTTPATHKAGKQLDLILTQNNLLDIKQSGFKSNHSTETALLSVTEALQLARATSRSSILILLELSAAFDNLGIAGTVLRWPDDPSVSACISSCLSDISVWMKEHHLKLNLGKSEILVIPAYPSINQNLTVQLTSLTLMPTRTTRNLGVILDDRLTFTNHISATARSCRFILYNIKKIRPYLTKQATQILVQALVISKLDYCNSLLSGLPASSINPLQMIHNAAACLVFNHAKTTHVTTLFISLHWLPVAARIKALMLTYKTLSGTAPSYLNSLLKAYVPSHNLRLISDQRLVVPTQRGAKSLSRTFMLAVPQWWNALAISIRTAESLTIFKKQLKTHLFCEHLTNS
ncbi:hypothetical protein AMELA_G00270780 [Ameiurus melas]|uniref:Endonuclease/exonuclease/phosphatase domain-containing protein n=1 Tax=Ameiurus melas TaxID=219545 RepID=A0A7J5ZNU6_AMEME|nr:hypothetical protein AMELA_G00270780 [Ameiurus melas]